MTHRLTFGQYNGLTYDEVLEHDLSYCEYINRSPVNKRNSEFKTWLQTNIQKGQAADLEKKREILRKRYTQQ